MNKHAFNAAISFFGSQARLAEAMGVSSMAVSLWKANGIPPKRAAQIEQLTRGKVTRGELLPEIFGPII